MRVHFHSDYLDSREVGEALSFLAHGAVPDSVVEAVAFDDPMDEQYGFLLPYEMGGDGPGYYYETLQLILAFGTVSAFTLFAKGFLTRAGELVAERLFKPAVKPYRDAAIDRERAKRAAWHDMAETELRAWLETTGEEPSSEQKSATFARWEAWSHEGLERLEYRGTLCVTLFVEDRKRVRSFTLTFEPQEERILGGAPFNRSTTQRFWERAALEIVLMREDLEAGLDPEAERSVDNARANRRWVAEAVRNAVASHPDRED